MTKSTTSTTICLDDAILCLTQSQTTRTTTHNELSLKIDSILDNLASLQINSSPPPPPFNTHTHKPHMKLEVLCFDGQDVMGWICKISQFFDYQGTPDEERITVASFYMDVLTLSWYKWMFRNGLVTSWHELLQALETRFAPSFYNDPKGALFKLTQRGSVNDYLTEFERSTNHIVGLLPTFLLSCFISGLSPDIHRKIQALQPISLPKATALPKLKEKKLEDCCGGYKGKGASSSTAANSSYRPNPLLVPTLSKIHFKKPTSKEMASRREKGSL